MAGRPLSPSSRAVTADIPALPRRASVDARLSPRVDALSSSPKYRAHLAPVFEQLAAESRGSWRETDASSPALRILTPPRRSDVALVAGYLDFRTARRAGYKRIALMEHGIGQSYSTDDPHLPGGHDRHDVGLFLSPNAHAASRDRARYPKARVEIVGAPILETLPWREGPRGRVVALTFHWHYTRIPEMRSAFEHFRSSIAQLAERFELIGHAHPQATGDIVPLYKRLGIRYEPSYRRVLAEADLLVADNTSAIYEFASTGRPVVLLNAPEYRRDVEHGLRFWEAADVGIQVDEPDELADAIEMALADPPERRSDRAAALDVVYRPGGSAWLAAQALEDWIAA